MMIEGDVFLLPQRRPKQRAIPVMRAETRLADRITFKEWLREVASLHKGEQSFVFWIPYYQPSNIWGRDMQMKR